MVERRVFTATSFEITQINFSRWILTGELIKFAREMTSPRGVVIFRRTQFCKNLEELSRSRYISQVDSCNSWQIDTNDRHLGGTQSDKTPGDKML